LVQSLLDAGGVELRLVGFGEGAAGSGSEPGNAVELSVERGAEGRQHRLCDGARVLRDENRREAEREDGEDEAAGQSGWTIHGAAPDRGLTVPEYTAGRVEGEVSGYSWGGGR